MPVPGRVPLSGWFRHPSTGSATTVTCCGPSPRSPGHAPVRGPDQRPQEARPSQPDYVLTEKGRDLTPVIMALTAWGDKRAAPAGPPVIFWHQSCGHQQLHCHSCQDQVIPGHGHGPAKTRFSGRMTDHPAAG